MARLANVVALHCRYAYGCTPQDDADVRVKLIDELKGKDPSKCDPDEVSALLKKIWASMADSVPESNL